VGDLLVTCSHKLVQTEPPEAALKGRQVNGESRKPNEGEGKDKSTEEEQRGDEGQGLSLSAQSAGIK